MLRTLRPHVGLRTVKTVVAVLLSMIIVDHLGATTSKLIFAMLGAMAAVQPTFKESVQSCIAQIAGVVVGALIGVVLITLLPYKLLSVGIGMVLTIVLYNVLKLTFSPSLPCFIVVLICTTDGIAPISYALGRIWDTAVGLAIGFIINILIMPYDTSKNIRTATKDLIRAADTFLENLFDGDDLYPTPADAQQQLSVLAKRESQFENQKLVLHLRKQRRELERFKQCKDHSQLLVMHIEALHNLGQPGRLDSESRQIMEDSGLTIRDLRTTDTPTERDIVTNYHVHQLLRLRYQLMNEI